MKINLVIWLLFITVNVNCQIDQTMLIIGRNTGTHVFHDGESTRIFGFTSTLSEATKIPGPTIICNSGDSVRLNFLNLSQGAPHTIHLHGMDVDQQNDGVPEYSFEVMHDEMRPYFFKAPHPGTYLYHCHVGSAVHLQAGMYGLVIVRPINGSVTQNWDNGETYAREFSLLASEVDTTWHNDTILDHEHGPGMMLMVPKIFKPQYFLINGMSGSQLSAPSGHFYALENEKIYLRLANIGYYGARFIFPAELNARTVASDGRPLPAELISDTVEVLPGERFETFVQLGSTDLTTFFVEYFNLNTGITEETQDLVFNLSSAGLQEMDDQSSLFPNPSDGVVFLGVDPVDFELNSQEGKLISKGTSSYVDIRNYPSGGYIIRVGEKTFRIIKN
jgi:FtsP/CotA-like multicopper oxidase with cupredoxin domain